MNLASLEAVIRALNAEGVRYLVAGGLAVAAHGYVRLTADVDLVIRLQPANVAAAFRALATLGYRPSVPVTYEGFADATQRERWMRDKNMQVLNFYSDAHRLTGVDIFASEPFHFDTEYADAMVHELAPGVPMRFVSLRCLMKMKETADRPRDRDDLQHLRWILEEGHDEQPQ